MSPVKMATLVTLIVLEVVLGIGNLTFVSIMADRPPEAERPRARMLGINAALIFRLALPVLFFFVDGLTAPVFSPFGNVFSWRDEILTTSPDHSKR